MGSTVEQIVILYAPIAGLVGLSFWTGVLSNRVSQIEFSLKGEGDIRPTLATLNATVHALDTRLSEFKTDTSADFAEVHKLLRQTDIVKK